MLSRSDSPSKCQCLQSPMFLFGLTLIQFTSSSTNGVHPPSSELPLVGVTPSSSLSALTILPVDIRLCAGGQALLLDETVVAPSPVVRFVAEGDDVNAVAIRTDWDDATTICNRWVACGWRVRCG